MTCASMSPDDSSRELRRLHGAPLLELGMPSRQRRPGRAPLIAREAEIQVAEGARQGDRIERYPIAHVGNGLLEPVKDARRRPRLSIHPPEAVRLGRQL